MRKVGLIGCGAIGTAIVELWKEHLSDREKLVAILVRSTQIATTMARVGRGTLVTADVNEFHGCALDVVIEAAGHGAVAQCSTRLLERGCDIHLLSAGALADDDLRHRLELAAKRGGARIIIPTGALAGFDGLRSLKTAGLIAVKYTSVKPVSAWRGTAAESTCRLDGLVEPWVVFAGPAKVAALAFPRNANLAASVALAGIGFERTCVELIADPHVTENSGRIEATSKVGRLEVTLTGASFSENPKSSRITAVSAIATLQDRAEIIRVC